MIEVRGLSYSYTARGPVQDSRWSFLRGQELQRVQALSDVSLSIPEGQFVSIIGPSGCGKSTLLRLLSDLLKAREGQITIGNKNPEKARKSRDIGFVFQDPALMPWRSSLSNVLLPLQIMGDQKDERRRAQAMLKLVGLGDFQSKRPDQLSGGMRQRVSIARALTYSPRVLLMDEPFGALDQLTREEMNQELLRIWDSNRTTVVFVTHSIAEAVYLSDRVLVMTHRPGTIAAEVDITLPRPRVLDLRRSQEFFDLESRVLRGLGGDV
jgi:NitT/TauT family transport system ATP-binding protein